MSEFDNRLSDDPDWSSPDYDEVSPEALTCIQCCLAPVTDPENNLCVDCEREHAAKLLKKRCAWCDPSICDPEDDRPDVTHGICPDCSERMIATHRANQFPIAA